MPLSPPHQWNVDDLLTESRMNELQQTALRNSRPIPGKGILIRELPQGGTIFEVQDQHPQDLFQLIAVGLVTDGGTAGNKTTVCSFTYTATDKGNTGIEYDTLLVPQTFRTQVGKRIAATWGIGMFTAPDTFQLIVAFEEAASRGCTTP